MRKQTIAVLVLLALVVLGCSQQQQKAASNQQIAQAAGKAPVAPAGVTNPQKNYLTFEQGVPGTVVGVLPVSYGYFVSVAKDGNVQNPKVYRDVVTTQKYALGQPVTAKVNVHDQVVGIAA